MALGFETLLDANTLTPSNRQALLNNISKDNMSFLALNMVELNEANILTTENISTLVFNTAHSPANPVHQFSAALSMLKNEKMLDQASYDELGKNIKNAVSGAEDFISLKQYEEEARTPQHLFNIYDMHTKEKVGAAFTKDEAIK